MYVIPNAAPRCAGGRRGWRRRGGGGGAARGGKGYDRLIRAFTWCGRSSRVAAAHLRRRAARARLAALIDELRLGDRVELAGKVVTIEAELEASLGLRAQLAREGLPLALLEAMAKGARRWSASTLPDRAVAR